MIKEQELRDIFMHVPTMMAVVKGPDHRYDFANEMYTAISARGRNLIGMSVAEAFPELITEGVIELLDRVYRTGETERSEPRRLYYDLHHNPDSNHFYKMTFSPVRDQSGMIEGIFILGAEVSDLVQANKLVEESREEYKNLILHAPVATGVYRTLDLIIEFANPLLLDMFGKGDGVIGMPLGKALPELEGQPFIGLLQDVYKTGIPYHTHEQKATLVRDGIAGDYWFNFTYQPLFDLQGNVSGILHMAIDVTFQVAARLDLEEAKAALRMNEKQLEEVVERRTSELKHANLNLQQLNESLQQFVYVASHDLQEPLRKINIFSNMLQERYAESLDDSGKSFISKVAVSAQRMSRLITDLLDFSSIGSAEKKYIPTDLNIVLQNILEDYELLIAQKHAKVELGELPLIESVPLQMNQLFYNLVGNALKFSRPDVSPVVSITSRILMPDQLPDIKGLRKYWRYAEISIMDNGIGFDEQYAERIFEIFQRLHHKSAYEGTGIGLSLSRKITENHQGYISASSESGAGATFTVYLPVDRKTI